MKRKWEKSAFALLSMFFFMFGGLFHPLFHAIPHAVCCPGAEPAWHQAPSPDWDAHCRHIDCPVCATALELLIPTGFDCSWPAAIAPEGRPESVDGISDCAAADCQPRAPPLFSFDPYLLHIA